MSIIGLGTDIIEIDRIQEALDKYGMRFLNKMFTEAEQAYCLKHSQPARHLAGRFAAKEAVVKALGSGFRDGISFLDIEVVNDEQGKPHVRFSPKLQHYTVLLSISHCKQYATATAILVE
jgi:holo-[acyl-carrier protein] synthase